MRWDISGIHSAVSWKNVNRAGFSIAQWHHSYYHVEVCLRRLMLFEMLTYNTMVHERPVYEALLLGFDRTAMLHRMNSRPFDHVMNGDVSFTIYLLVTRNRIKSPEKLKVQLPWYNTNFCNTMVRSHIDSIRLTLFRCFVCQRFNNTKVIDRGSWKCFYKRP